MAKLRNTSLFSDGNLISYYELEDTADSKGSNTLTNNNTVAFNAARYANGGDLGSGNTNKSLSVASNLGIAGNGDFSISFWVKLRDEIASGNYTLFNVNSTLTADRYIDFEYQYNAGTRRFQIDVAGTSFTYTITLGTSSFNHIVLTRNVSGNATKLYINDVNVASGTVGSGGNVANTFYLGSFTGGTINPSSAIFDDVGIFNRVLAQGDVDILFNDAASASPSASKSQSPSASQSPSSSASASASKSASSSASASASASQSPSASASKSASSSASASASPSQSPSSSQSASASASGSASVSASPSASVSPSPAEYQNNYSTVGNTFTDKYTSTF